MSHPKEILLSLQANARKSLSQNFLTSPHWAEKLASAALETEANEIWEIGPGLGAITEFLNKKSKPLTLFEYDKKFVPYLGQKFPGARIIAGDFLEADLDPLLPKSGKVAVLSNLPYHISSQAFFKLLKIRERMTRMVLTFQKEFAEKVAGKPNSKNYGSLSIMAQTFFQIDSLGTLPPKAFYPAPSIASEALLFEPRRDVRSSSQLEPLVRAAFSQRRKKMVQNLKKAFPQVPWSAVFAALKIDENTRAEQLEREVFVLLAEKLQA